MKVIPVGFLVLLLSASTLSAQDKYLEAAKLEADSLRARLDCPSEMEWPPLPPEGWEVFRPGTMDSSGDHAVMVPDSMREARTDILIPQYAYFYDAGAKSCEPVILLQAEGLLLGYQAVGGGHPTVALEVYFDLLGTEPPQGSQLREDGI